jgi:hypothetical protein
MYDAIITYFFFIKLVKWVDTLTRIVKPTWAALKFILEAKVKTQKD